MKIAAIVVGVLALFAGMLAYSVWRARVEPVVSAPGPVEAGRAKLHQQLADAQAAERDAEKQSWNNLARLRTLEAGHEQRAQALKDNPEAQEIVAYDRAAIARLKQRIAELEAEPQDVPAPAPAPAPGPATAN